MSFRQACLAVLIALTMLGPMSSALMSPPPISAAQDEDTSTVDKLPGVLGKLQEALEKTRKDRDKYKARLEKANEKIAALEATIAALEAAQPESTPIPTTASDRSATSDERAYWQTANAISGGLIMLSALVSQVSSNPDFASDVSLWYVLSDAMQPFHQLWAEWQSVSYPTERLAAYHTAMTDALYNYDLAATAFETGLANLDADYIETSVDYILEASDALDRAADAANVWEKETGTRVDSL